MTKIVRGMVKKIGGRTGNQQADILGQLYLIEQQIEKYSQFDTEIYDKRKELGDKDLDPATGLPIWYKGQIAEVLQENRKDR